MQAVMLQKQGVMPTAKITSMRGTSKVKHFDGSGYNIEMMLQSMKNGILGADNYILVQMLSSLQATVAIIPKRIAAPVQLRAAVPAIRASRRSLTITAAAADAFALSTLDPMEK